MASGWPRYLDAYGVVGLVLLAGLAFVTVAFAANRLLRPSAPGVAKELTYECGVDPIDPVGQGWAQSQIRYYVYAYLYVVFAVDVMYLFPWATVFAAPGFGAVTLVEMAVFLGFIAAGLAYAWRRGALRWP